MGWKSYDLDREAQKLVLAAKKRDEKSLNQSYIPVLSLSGKAIALKPHEATNTSYTIRKKWVLYLLLGKISAIACYIKALEFRNGKCFRRVTEQGYNQHTYSKFL